MVEAYDKNVKVAPLAGAWIEILFGMNVTKDITSLPSRERGLKFTINYKKMSKIMSLPSRERGLKSCSEEAKIEIKSRSPRGSVD